MTGALAAEAVAELRRAASAATALVMKLEEAESTMRAAKASTEQQRQAGNMTEWARALRVRAETLAARIAESA